MKKSLGIYIHIPFCIKKCGYCDFCSFPASSEELKVEYVNELCRRIAQYNGKAGGYSVDTVYFGGGTPSTLSADLIERILSELRSTFCISADAEITIECNPATVGAEYFCQLRRMGINRLSMGLQSAVDSELALLGRAHTAEKFDKSFYEARAAGFDNISADVMYGIPDQTPESLRYTLNHLISLSPEHISAYGLMIEDGTYFAEKLSELCIADDDGQYEMYRICSEHLAAHGYDKYEISNFSKNGKHSRHNLRYWKGLEYIGFGVAAHSNFDGKRFGNSRDLSAFLRGEDITEECVILTDKDISDEYIMLRLRLGEGICLSDYSATFGKELSENCFSGWIDGGFMKLEHDRLSFTDKGFFVSNTIIAEILDAQA